MNKLATLPALEISQRLRQPLNATFDVPNLDNGQPLKQAAVLVPFVNVDDEWHLLFIQRSVHENDQHSGQVAFAGGKAEDADENMQATALREAHEEIGVLPSDVTVLGALNHHYSISRFQITPIVATLPWPYDLTLQTTEVATTFTIPLSWLADANHYRIEQRQLSGRSSPVVYFTPYDGYVLWGATARMVLSLLELLSADSTTTPYIAT